MTDKIILCVMLIMAWSLGLCDGYKIGPYVLRRILFFVLVFIGLLYFT
jgi:hypothetical protein